jgi:hypothetical protein
MFLFLKNGEFFSFWSNSVGDVFVENTIKNLELNPSEIKVFFFSELQEAPKFYAVSGTSLVIKKQIITVLDNGTEEESFVDEKSIQGELFFDNGKMIKPC